MDVTNLTLLGITLQGFEDWAVIWLPIIFMGLIVVLLGLALKVMPSSLAAAVRFWPVFSSAWRIASRSILSR